jgi:WD repeat-containing protein 61
MESSSKINKAYQQGLVIRGHSSPIYCLDISIDGFLYSGAGDRFLAKWNLETGLQEKFSIQFDSAVYCIKQIGSTPYMAVGLNNGNIHIINLNEKKEERLLKMSDSSVFSLNYSEKDELLFATSGDSKLGIWHVPSFDSYQMIQFSSGKIRASILVDNEIIIACQTGEIRRINFKELKETSRFQSHDDSVNCLKYWAEKNIIISGGKDATINFNDLDKKEVAFSLVAHNFSVYDLVIQENSLLSASMDKSVKVWDMDNLELKQKLAFPNVAGHKRSVNTLIKGRYENVFSAGDDGTIIEWKKYK